MAKKLEGKPFHVIASHCQANPKSEVVAYLKSKKLSPHAPNFTVTRQGRHPKVNGNGYVPYYMVFDHRGKLRQEHMCGDYHGGDGLAMIDWVNRLLKEAPALYLGEEPFHAVPKLARQIERKKGLAASVKQVEADLPTAEGAAKAELQRLHDAVRAYRDRELERVEALLATHPEGVETLLRTLGKELKGTGLGAPVAARADELRKSGDLKASLAAAKALAKVEKRLEKNNSSKARAAAVRKIDALLAKYGALPFARTLQERKAELEG